jgi:peptidoglycan/LPS O-acetylase OafA/YrhL
VSVTSGERAPTAPGDPGHPAPDAAPNLTPPPGNPRFPLFDSLRAIAALSVFAGHTITGTFTLQSHQGRFVWATHVAYEGVAIFFLVSGFLLYRPFLVGRMTGRRLSLTGYGRRRLLRIVPAYWAALSVFLILGFVGGVNGGNWWVFYGFGQNYEFNTIGNGIGAAWTLCIEVTFYAALPLFAWVAASLSSGRRSIRGDVVLLVVLGAGALAFRAHFSAFSDLATVSTLPGTFFWFALGMGLAVASVHERSLAAMGTLGSRVRHWPTISWAVAAALFLALHELSHATSSLGTTADEVAMHALYAIVALFILAPAVFGQEAGGPVRRLLRQPALAWIGLISYAFYLYHTIVIAQLAGLARDHGWPARYWVVALASLVVSLACAAVSFYVLERPLMRLGVRRRGRPPTASR